MNDIVLSPLLQVRGRRSAQTCSLLGPIFVDPQTADILAFGVAQTVMFGDRHIIAARASEETVLSDEVSYISLKPVTDQSVEALLVGIKLKQKQIDTRIYEMFTPSPDVECAQWPSGDSKLFILGQNWTTKEVDLISLDSSFSMPNPLTGAMSSFDNALELRAINDAPLIERGEAGALVLDEVGNWVGVVVAGSRRAAFAAPLLPIIDRLMLKVPTIKQVQLFNRRLNRTADPSGYEAAEIKLRWEGPIPTRIRSMLGQTAKSIRDDVALADSILA